MRLKIILPNAIIILLVGLLSYFVVRQRLMTLDDPAAVKASAERAALGAAGNLQLQLLRTERWLAENGSTESVRDRLSNVALNDKARREKATAALSELKRHAGEAKTVFAEQPDLAAIIDKDGKAVGRSEDSQTYDGDAFASEYPALVAAIKENRTGSDIWLSSRFSHKHLVSYAPVRDQAGNALGMVVFAWSLSDERLAKLSDGAAALVVIEGGAPKVKAKANDGAAPGLAADLEGADKEAVTRALKNNTDSFTAGGIAGGIAALRNVGNGDKAVLAVGRKISMIESPDAIVWPILAAAGLGLAFVIIAGSILGGYITDPVGRMEESLLQVINGNTNNRIQIEHAELGGLAFRINQLLNTVLGVEEDNTDEEGRPSVPPAPGHFQDAMAVDESRGAPDAAQAAALAAEPEGAYYARLYREYIEAKRANGEGVDGITEDVFTNRIRGMERDSAAKMGRQVRYAVQRREGQVRLLAIPL
ncbi:MAG: MXAN_5187 C-terminal domain-containing protein [Polyangiales bacterium]